MSPATLLLLPRQVRFPRVSGDEPGNDVPTNDQPQFSPRERG